MNRYFFAGLFLILLTLCSCSRKKEKSVAVTDAESQPEVYPQEQSVKNNFFGAEITDTAGTAGTEAPEEVIDEEFLAEEERYGTEVLNFLEDEANFTSPIVEDTVESVETRIVDAYNRLKVMEFESEVFIPSVEQDSSVLIHYSNKIAERLFYDNLYRLTKKEYWQMDSVENARIKGKEIYSFEGDSKSPYEKRIESDSSVFVSKLDENGLVIRTEKYEVKDSVTGKKPVQTTTWTYDDKKRITSETLTQEGFTKKQVFNYAKTDGDVKPSRVKGKNEESEEAVDEEDSTDDIPPDYEYYENGVLVTETEYTKKGSYSTTIWFDSTNSVRTDYEDYVKVRDVYFSNGIERRVRTYE